MQIIERAVGDVTVLDLKGRLVVGDGDELFRDTLNRLIQLGRKKILLNLDEVTYLDSGGLGAMVAKYISICKRDGHLKLCNVHGRPLKVLDITRLLTVFEAFDSEAEALKSFA
jgi:anti-sigma B factor antagonist